VAGREVARQKTAKFFPQGCEMWKRKPGPGCNRGGQRTAGQKRLSVE
jgi:hypothetical protein